MDDGPTTAGSIVGRLKMDRDQWVADMQRTKTDARELSALEPKIKIDADVSTALAKLEQVRAAAEAAGVHTTSSVTATSIPAGGSVSAGAAARVDAVAAAERRLALAVSASDSATARAIVAEMRFEESRDKRKRTAVQVAASELALAEAVKRADNAAARATLAEDALAAAQRKAAKSALAKAAAEETEAGATEKSNSANSTNASRMGMIVAAVAALLPMMVPLAAFTVGAAGALTMMGVSGVVALKGIHDEMAAGTELGATYGAGIQGLKGDFDQLSHTGAVSMLSSFTSTGATLSAAMPMLNRMVGEFTGYLGRTGSNLFSGAISGLHVIEPLLTSVSGWVERLSEGFKSWTTDGGLQSFTRYALSTLPQVEDTLGALTSAVMHILEALAPLGTVGLAVLTGISDGINAIPTPLLTALVSVAAVGYATFLLWKAVPAIIGAVSTAIEVMSGPVGWVVAGVAALVTVLALVNGAAQKASSGVGSYTAALEADNGAIGANMRAQAAKALVDDGALKAGKALGVSEAILTDAALGHADATDKVTAAHTAWQVATLKAVKTTGNMTAAQKAAGDQWDTVTKGIDAQKAAIKDATTNGISYNAAMQLGGSVAETMAAGLGMTVGAYERLVGAQNNATASAKTWKTEMDILNGVAQTLEQTNIALATDYQNMESSVTASIKKLGKAKATSLSLDTAAGIANHSMVLQGIQDAQAHSTAIITAEGGTAKAREDGRLALIKSRDDIVKHMTALGFDKAAVERLIDAELKIPAHIKTQVEIDTAAAEAKIAALKADMAGIQRVITVRVNTITSGATNPTRSYGLGDGGINLGTPKKKKAGGGTVFGTGSASSDSVPHLLSTGEEVISNMRGQADKYRPLLKAINAGHVPQTMMAGTVAAAPAVMGGAAHSGRGGNNIHVTLNNPVSRNPVEDARIAGQILNASIHV